MKNSNQEIFEVNKLKEHRTSGPEYEITANLGKFVMESSIDNAKL